jgi:hypothetical protein
MKHTQGNWTVDNNNGTHGVCRIVADKPGTDRVLGIMECCGASPEREANARLISAAPDLLAALEALLWQWDNNDKQLCGMALQDARAAVNNVKGK